MRRDASFVAYSLLFWFAIIGIVFAVAFGVSR